MTTHSYYAAYKLLTSKKEPTGLHTTVLFRHDTDEKTLQTIMNELKNLNLKNKFVRILGDKYLDGPKGEPNMIKTCLLDLLDTQHNQDSDGLDKLNELCKNFTYRRYLETQHPFTFHISIGNKNPDNKKYMEYVNNQKTLDDNGGIDSLFILGDLYIKNLDTKEITTI